MASGNGQVVRPEQSESVAGRSLPAVLQENEGKGTILLFYQYVEPCWTKNEHHTALKKVIEIGQKHDITGRGRVAREGLNCTLTGLPHQVRAFCNDLRDWKPDLFRHTDFKLTDGIERSKLFKSLSIRKCQELVAYGLSGDKAPSLEKFGGTHLEAPDYHKAMQDPNTVIVDVRNAYESAIGSFQPPKNGAKLLDPKMRNSIEFPKWLASPETQEQLTGKTVLMYCTGGIRCERATALLNQMSAVSDKLKPKGVYHCRGGIERYVKTFPTGGYWSGKNYLFDKRMEQTPEMVESIQQQQKDSEHEPKQGLGAKCCLCRSPYSVYRGQFKCNRSLCGVPVIVCDTCRIDATEHPEQLICELCREGHRIKSTDLDLVAQKRKAEALIESRQTTEEQMKRPKTYHADRLFLRRLPLTSTFSKIQTALRISEEENGKEHVLSCRWLVDREHEAFYGSCIVQMANENVTKQVLKRSKLPGGIKVDKKRIKVELVFEKDEADSSATINGFGQTEYPPLGKYVTLR